VKTVRFKKLSSYRLVADYDRSYLPRAASLWATCNLYGFRRRLLTKNSVHNLQRLQFCACSGDRLVRTRYESQPNMINVFIRSPGPPSGTATLSDLLMTSPSAFVVKWSHPAFTLNSNSRFTTWPALPAVAMRVRSVKLTIHCIQCQDQD
jgi:hypothetical protein